MNLAITSTNDSEGGAARCAYRLHRGLLDLGVESNMFVRNKSTDDPTVFGTQSMFQKLVSMVTPKLDALPLAFYPEHEKFVFTPGNFGSFNPAAYSDKFDVFNVHWVAGGYQSISSITRINKPVVLTLHDSWAFTGGCHIPFECTRFMGNCGICPQLKSSKEKDLSYKVWLKKREEWKRKNIVLVGGSKWIVENARRSSIFADHRAEIVHPGMDLNIFKPLDKNFCRNILGLKETDKLLLFGAVSAVSDQNKGFQFLEPALKQLSEKYSGTDLKIIIFGASSANSPVDFGINVQYMGKMHDDISLAVLYSAADVMIVPSIQESFGQTASESFACGTPVAAFETSGLIDIVDHKINGFLARPYDPVDLSEGILWLLSDPDRLKILGIAARKKAVEKFGIKDFAGSYRNIYESLL
ncbi:MAG TPA: glycosyl transferase [Sphingobacteriaceae bacterium]|nr:glycosyl transferase [Sphingobacteriaceae bacterium]